MTLCHLSLPPQIGTDTHSSPNGYQALAGGGGGGCFSRLGLMIKVLCSEGPWWVALRERELFLMRGTMSRRRTPGVYMELLKYVQGLETSGRKVAGRK